MAHDGGDGFLLTEAEEILAERIKERTGKKPIVEPGLVRYFYRDRDGYEQSREVEYGPHVPMRKRRLEALRHAATYARLDHVGQRLS